MRCVHWRFTERKSIWSPGNVFIFDTSAKEPRTLSPQLLPPPSTCSCSAGPGGADQRLLWLLECCKMSFKGFFLVFVCGFFLVWVWAAPTSLRFPCGGERTRNNDPLTSQGDDGGCGMSL